MQCPCMSNSWTKVTRKEPCQICGKHDWCTVGDRWHCCMRIANDKPCKNGGWLWPINGAFKPPPPIQQWKPTARPNFGNLMEHWQLETLPLAIGNFAEELGVHHTALYNLGCAWSKTNMAWAFPMTDGIGNVVGIRLRNHEGQKWAVKGSQQGLFVPSSKSNGIAFICEGPTDTAAALTLGFWAVGRPSCCCGNEQLKALFRNRHIQRAVIISDNDTPGINGAERLAKEIGRPCALMVLPAKDIREFVNVGGTHDLIETQLRQTLWRT